MTHQSQEAPVLSEIINLGSARGGVGRITLNVPKSLNSLNLEIIVSVRETLAIWAKDPRVACVVLEGAGEKAFCAGGDVKRLFHFITQCRARGESPVPLCQVFFENEYRLDYAIHRYTKPIVVWGDGIVMGGGLGLMAGASHRIVTEKTLMAMPEISIGLYPDVGASRFLNRMPGRAGWFLGLTGSRFAAGDALYLGIADTLVARDSKASLMEALARLPYEGNNSDAERVSECIRGFAGPRPRSVFEERQAEIDQWMAGEDVEGILDRLQSLPPGDSFLEPAIRNLNGGSPTSLKVTFEQLRRSQGISLEDAFRQELILSLQCCAHSDFAEGVRALLVDKDNAPRWQPSTIAQVGGELVAEHFRAPWTDEEEHPLQNL